MPCWRACPWNATSTVTLGVALSIVYLAVLPLSADGGAQPTTPPTAPTERTPRAPKRHHSVCQPDDARCVALHADICDPFNTTATDKCVFVQADQHCLEDVQRFNYLAFFYCSNKAVACGVLLAWATLLFLVMTITAEAFLCPAIEYLASWLKLAPDIAGITLFAFASGAPDLFTQVAALAHGNHVDVELAVSATLGSGLFIICVVLATIILMEAPPIHNPNTPFISSSSSSSSSPSHIHTTAINGHAYPPKTTHRSRDVSERALAFDPVLSATSAHPQVPDRRAFVRDASAYLLSTCLALMLFWSGTLTVLGGLLLVSGYAIYLTVCLLTRSSNIAGGRGGTADVAAGLKYARYTGGILVRERGQEAGSAAAAVLPAPAPEAAVGKETALEEGNVWNNQFEFIGNKEAELVPLALAREGPVDVFHRSIHARTDDNNSSGSSRFRYGEGYQHHAATQDPGPSSAVEMQTYSGPFPSSPDPFLPEDYGDGGDRTLAAGMTWTRALDQTTTIGRSHEVQQPDIALKSPRSSERAARSRSFGHVANGIASATGNTTRGLTPFDGITAIPSQVQSPSLRQHGGGSCSDGTWGEGVTPDGCAVLLPMGLPAVRTGHASSWLARMRHDIEDLLHLHGLKGPRKWFGCATAPVALMLHATMPAATAKDFGVPYGIVLSLAAPLFFLYATSLTPYALGRWVFCVAWGASSAALAALIFTLVPSSTEPSQMHGNYDINKNVTTTAMMPSSSRISIAESDLQDPTFSYGVRREGAAAAAATVHLPMRGIVEGAGRPRRRPRKNLVFALVAFVQCIVWLNAAADEVVALFEAAGRIWNVRQDVLGATVLSWGETTPDLVATVALARGGQATMAMAAVFGGPCFNLLLSMGGPILFAAVRNGAIEYHMTSGVLVLGVATVAVLLFLVLAIPLRCTWELPRSVGVALLCIYAAVQAVFLLADAAGHLV